VVLRIFTAYVDGQPLTRIVKTLNEMNVPGRVRRAKGWSPATVSRILDNEKYAGRWIWNRTESRRDPRTGRRRRFAKPESEWLVREDENLRIVPSELWKSVRARRQQMHRTSDRDRACSRNTLGPVVKPAMCDDGWRGLDAVHHRQAEWYRHADPLPTLAANRRCHSPSATSTSRPPPGRRPTRRRQARRPLRGGSGCQEGGALPLMSRF
jgi:Recombinase